MIHTINIITKTREGDVYSEVAINKFPIIYIDDESAENILDDSELISVIRKHLKSKITYHNASLNIRTISDDLESVEDSVFKLSDKITIPEWV